MYLVSIITLATIVMEKKFLKSFQLKKTFGIQFDLAIKLLKLKLGSFQQMLHTQSNVIRALEIFEIVQAVLEKNI